MIAQLNNNLLTLPNGEYMQTPSSFFVGTPTGWYKASHVVKDVNNKVERMDDLTGNGNHLYQNDQAKKPTYVANSLNGHPVLNFNAANSQFLNGGNIHNVAEKSALIFVVGNVVSGTNAMFLLKFVDTSAPRYSIGKEATIFYTSFNNNINSAYRLNTAFSTFGNYHTLSSLISRNGLRFRFFIDNVEKAQTTIANVDANMTGDFVVGRGPIVSYDLTGNIAEILVYIGNYDDATVLKINQSVNNYLKLKYNL